MSIEQEAANVWEHSPAKGTNFIIHLAIAKTSTTDGICIETIANLAKAARVEIRQAQRAIGWLITNEQIALFFDKGRPNIFVQLCGLSSLQKLARLSVAQARYRGLLLRGGVTEDTPVIGDTPVMDDTPTPVMDDTPTPVMDDTPLAVPLSPMTPLLTPSDQIRSDSLKNLSDLRARLDALNLDNADVLVQQYTPEHIAAWLGYVETRKEVKDKGRYVAKMLLAGKTPPAPSNGNGHAAKPKPAKLDPPMSPEDKRREHEKFERLQAEGK